jgi:hypothetical protein
LEGARAGNPDTWAEKDGGSPGLRPISANLFGMFFLNSRKNVILRVCNFIGFEKKLMLKTKGLGASKVAKNQ